VHGGAVNQRDVWQVEDASPKVTMYGRLARILVAEAASRLISCPEATNLMSCIESQRTAPPATSSAWKPGRSLFDGSQSSGEEGVYVPALRHRLAALAGRGEDLALEDQNPVKVVGEYRCSQESGDACTDHDRGV
jgi:hypothetical protein